MTLFFVKNGNFERIGRKIVDGYLITQFPYLKKQLRVFSYSVFTKETIPSGIEPEKATENKSR
jgi:hypothetical protein